MSSLRTSTVGLALIKAFEGCRLKAYKCPAGVWTVGWGHTGVMPDGTKVGPNTKVTQAQADAIFVDDIDHFEDGVEAMLKVEVSVNEFDTLVSFAFNAGKEALRTSTLLKRVNAEAGDDAVANEFVKWNKITVTKGGKKVKEISPGLSRRRRAEAALWRGDIEGAEAIAGTDFPDMPQAVAAPEAPKVAESKQGNAIATVGGAGVVATVKGAVDKVHDMTEPVQQVVTQAQTVTAATSDTASQAQQTVTNTTQAVQTVTEISTGIQWASLMPYLFILLLIIVGAAYAWHCHQQELKDQGA